MAWGLQNESFNIHKLPKLPHGGSLGFWQSLSKMTKSLSKSFHMGSIKAPFKKL